MLEDMSSQEDISAVPMPMAVLLLSHMDAQRFGYSKDHGDGKDGCTVAVVLGRGVFVFSS